MPVAEDEVGLPGSPFSLPQAAGCWRPFPLSRQHPPFYLWLHFSTPRLETQVGLFYPVSARHSHKHMCPFHAKVSQDQHGERMGNAGKPQASENLTKFPPLWSWLSFPASPEVPQPSMYSEFSATIVSWAWSSPLPGVPVGELSTPLPTFPWGWCIHSLALRLQLGLNDESTCIPPMPFFWNK